MPTSPLLFIWSYLRNWEGKQNITKDGPIVLWDYKRFRSQKPKTKYIPQYHPSNKSDPNPASTLNQQLAIWLLILKVKILKHAKILNVHTVKRRPLFLLWYCPLLSLKTRAPSWGQMSILGFLLFLNIFKVCACVQSFQPCPTLATRCTVAPRPSVHELLQADYWNGCHALDQGSLRPGGWTASLTPVVGRWVLTTATWEALVSAFL